MKFDLVYLFRSPHQSVISGL